MMSYRLERIGVLALLMLVAGCSEDLLGSLAGIEQADLTQPGDVSPADAAAPDPVPTAEVGIRFINATTGEAVNVQFYATNEPLENVPEDLFASEKYLVTANVGIAGTGLIEPGEGDEITFECTDDLTFGTLGGAFLDNETGEPRGRGEMRWLSQAALGLCGQTVTFGFTGNGETFRTRLTIN